VEVAGFDAAMARQRADARKAWSGSGDASEETIWFDMRDRLGATEFLGYSTEMAEGQVLGLVRDGAEIEVAEAGESVAVVVNQTPFYGESGGQVGDTGVMFTAQGAELPVDDTRKRVGDLHVHHGTLAKGTLAVGDVVELRVDSARRDNLRGHHSATHLLHAALRERLGDHVTQKGSMVAPDRLRFDISHPKAIGGDALRQVADDVNREIRANGAVTTRLMTPDEAIEAGAMALFGEKYGDEVRVVAMGGSNERPYSVELCGGTHARRTGDIGLFKILSESAVAAGVRRIEAVTGQAALAYLEGTETLLREAAGALNVPPDQLPARVTALMDERRRLETELTEARRKLATGGGDAEGAGHKDVAGIAFAGRAIADVPARELKSLADDLKRQVGSGVVAICAATDGKASLVVGVTDDLTGRISAVDLVRVGAAALGGKGGGGRPDMAQAGGPDATKTEAALAAIEQALAETVSG
jgi:alanyl-tRNA synthetase